MKWLLRVGHGVVLPLVILVCWEAASRAGLLSPIVAPPPSAVLSRMIEAMMPNSDASGMQPGIASAFAWLLSGELVQDTLASMMRVAGGFLLGAVLALPIGASMGAKPGIYRLCNPLLQILRPIPPIAYIPLAIIWFGIGNPPAFFLIALGAFFPILINYHRGCAPGRW